MSSISPQQAALLDKGIIELHGEVEEEMFRYVYECMLELTLRDFPPIRVSITSPGGAVAVGLIIHDMLRLYPGKKTGVVVAYARSIALVILQACDKRECTRHSSVLLHNVGRSGVDLWELIESKELEKVKKSMLADQEKIFAILEQRTKQSRNTITRLCRKANQLSSQEALKFRLIDEII